MKRLVLLFTLLAPCVLSAQQVDDFDYFEADRTIIRNGVQAVLMCNGLFTSGRTLEQVFNQELAYLKNPVGTIDGGEYLIDQKLKAVSNLMRHLASNGYPSLRVVRTIRVIPSPCGIS